jgi:hypothetical protein
MFIVACDVTYLTGTDRVATLREFDHYQDALNHIEHVAANYSRNMNDGFVTALLFTVTKTSAQAPYFFWFQYNDATRSFSTHGEGWTAFDKATTSYAL